MADQRIELELTTQLRTRNLSAIALPKTDSPDHIDWLVLQINRLAAPEKRTGGSDPIRIIAMIESARAMVGIKEIAQSGQGHLDGLLVGSDEMWGWADGLVCSGGL
jgi:citrate lyase subunit beta-like protein